MKAVDFDYCCPTSVTEACRLLGSANGDGRIIAGGQTLVPLLAMRLARPSLLVDITRIPDLRGIELDDSGVTLKACTTQADALASDVIRRHIPLLAKALQFVGHIQTRNRGTIGGSLANADSVAEICLVAQALDCKIVASSGKTERTIPAGDFFRGTMTTDLSQEECLTAARMPAWREPGRIGTGFKEVSIRRSDFALAAAAVQAVFDEAGVCRRIAIAVGGCSSAPMRLRATSERLAGTRLDDGDLDAAVDSIQEEISPQSDLLASADYRRRVVGPLVKRAIVEARLEAGFGEA